MLGLQRSMQRLLPRVMRCLMCLLQVTIQEGRFVILSQQRAEQAIAAHAVQVTTELGSTAADLSDVFGRLSSALQVTGGDRDALKVSQQSRSNSNSSLPFSRRLFEGCYRPQ